MFLHLCHLKKEFAKVNKPEESEEELCKGSGRGLFRLRRILLPLGINLEKANYLLAAGIAAGAGENLVFLGRFMMNVRGTKMPYFDVLMDGACLGYAAAIITVLFLQAYWNYAYYNKETKSVYVMKRLTDRGLYVRTIWAAPAIEGLIICMVMIVHLALDLGLYIMATPREIMQPDYYLHILPF